MTSGYEGAQVVGIDLRRRRSVVVRMTPEGVPLSTVRIANDPETLAAEIAKAGVHAEVVLEATYGWYWAVVAFTSRCGTGSRVVVGATSLYPFPQSRRPIARPWRAGCRFLPAGWRQGGVNGGRVPFVAELRSASTLGVIASSGAD